MDEFQLSRLHPSTVLIVYSDRNAIELNPEYQRIGGVWTQEKKQLLIDSLINGFDIPKLYFHEYVPIKHTSKGDFRYSIIDGQQRLAAIWDFIDGKLNLAEDFKYLRDDSVEAGGLDYSTLARRYPQVRARFDSYPLDIITIRTGDSDLIEDMFYRLNEAVPLNAPEKRSALGGPIPANIKRLSTHDFFVKCLPFKDNRYRHRDLSAKFLLIDFENRIVNTKKARLDQLVKDFKHWREDQDEKADNQHIEALVASVTANLDAMKEIFVMNDTLLRQVGMVTVYYYLCRNVRLKVVGPISREMLTRFEVVRRKNRELAELKGETAKEVDNDLLAFDRHSQTPNDAYALRIRLGILLGYLKEHFHVPYSQSLLDGEK